MAFEFKSETFGAELSAAEPLEKVLRRRYPEASWNAIRKLIATRKVKTGGAVAADARQLVAPNTEIQIQMTAPKPKPGFEAAADRVLYCDPHVIVVNKPAGISSVDHEDEPTSLQREIHAWLCRKERRPCPPLSVVHRLDKVTSGVMLFARNQSAQLMLKDQFRAHTTGRYYLALAHGEVHDGTLHFRLVRNRGDGLRGVTLDPNLGRHSVTHVKVKERLSRFTLVECQLETGRTHQIRIHLAQIGHPVVGDALYGKEAPGPGGSPSRTLLHAAFLSFTHPAQRRRLEFEQPLPDDFEAFLQRERQRATATR